MRQTNKKKSICTTVQGHQQGTYVNPERHSDKPVQETNLLFKANETSTPTTSGALEKQGRILPLCKAKAHSICFAHTNKAAHQSYYTASDFFKKLLGLFDLHILKTYVNILQNKAHNNWSFLVFIVYIFIYIYLLDIHVEVCCLAICNVFHFQKRKNSTHRNF